MAKVEQEPTTAPDDDETYPRRSKTDLVEGWLRELIVSGKLAPGKFIDKGQIARRLGTSRLPVTMALDRLERDGLVDVVPQVGTFVANDAAEGNSEIPQDMAREMLFLLKSVQDTATGDGISAKLLDRIADLVRRAEPLGDGRPPKPK